MNSCQIIQFQNSCNVNCTFLSFTNSMRSGINLKSYGPKTTVFGVAENPIQNRHLFGGRLSRGKQWQTERRFYLASAKFCHIKDIFQIGGFLKNSRAASVRQEPVQTDTIIYTHKHFLWYFPFRIRKSGQKVPLCKVVNRRRVSI